MKIESRRKARATPDAVGIVVRSGRAEAGSPRTAAFVWGVKLYPAPSLPFGRWKVQVKPAA